MFDKTCSCSIFQKTIIIKLSVFLLMQIGPTTKLYLFLLFFSFLPSSFYLFFLRESNERISISKSKTPPRPIMKQLSKFKTQNSTSKPTTKVIQIQNLPREVASKNDRVSLLFVQQCHFFSIRELYLDSTLISKHKKSICL